MFELSTDPPYKTGGIFLLENIFLSVFFMNFVEVKRSSDVGILPVPIDQIGS